MNNEGFFIIEVFLNCFINWGFLFWESMKRIENEVLKYYSLGIFKDKGRGI